MASESERDRREALADIASEMRTRSREVKEAFGGRPDGVENMLDIWADRLEALAKRERAPVGNAAAMREALEKVRFYLPYFLQYMRLHWEDTEAGGYYERILEVVNAALSAPPRQCDVGTPGEQRVRFESFCNRKGDGFSASAYCAYECPCGNKGDCKLAWAQTPYAEEGAGK